MKDTDDITIELENDGAEEKTTAKLKKLREEIKKIKKERDEYLDGWQRSKADYVNLSRRMREQEELLTRNQTAKATAGMITVFDSLEAAYKSAKSDSGELLEGIKQVMGQLETVLKEHTVVRFTPKIGEAFDPERHEPIQTVATKDDKLDNTISETLQSGYEISGTIIRPARVVVRKI